MVESKLSRLYKQDKIVDDFMKAVGDEFNKVSDRLF